MHSGESAAWNARGQFPASRRAHANSLPLLGFSYTSDFIAADRPAGGYGSEVAHRIVSRDYFATMKVPVLRGRGFTADDRLGAAGLVVAINERLAKAYFAGQDPIGQRSRSTRCRTRLGVADHRRRRGRRTSADSSVTADRDIHPIEQELAVSDWLVVPHDA